MKPNAIAKPKTVRLELEVDLFLEARAVKKVGRKDAVSFLAERLPATYFLEAEVAGNPSHSLTEETEAPYEG